MQTKQFAKVDYKSEDSTDKAILTDQVKKRIKDVSFEAVAISSTINLRKKAIKIYSEQAKTVKTKEERDFYQ